MNKMKKILSIVLGTCLILSAFPKEARAISIGSLQGKLEIEAASPDPSLNVAGLKKEINYFDSDLTGKDNYIAVLSSKYRTKTGITKTNCIAVQVDNTSKVTMVVNKAPSPGIKPPFNQSSDIDILPGGYVIIASDDSYATRGYKKFLAENFNVGDIVKLRLNDQIYTIDQLTAQIAAPDTDIIVNNEQMSTVTESTAKISGKLINLKLGQNYKLKINDKEVVVNQDLTYNSEIQLFRGTNYIDIVLYENDLDKIKKSVVVYRKDNVQEQKEVVLWIEQSPNSKTFQSSSDVEQMVLKAKDAGVTAFGIDVKGPEGFVSYKKNELSHSPYVSEMTSEKKKGSNPNLDLLEEYVKYAHKHGMKVYASINVFTEGNIELNESAFLASHPEWEEIVQRPEDKGSLLPISQSSYTGKLLTFVNPSNEEVQKLQLARFEEILKNYDVDGVNLDRGRYDNLYADFSDISKVKFQQYLSEHGKNLVSWPEDAFKISETGSLIKGKYYNEWWAFRSGVIKEFSKNVRELVDKYSVSKGKLLTLSAYVGSWYESLYQNGVNWASPNFRYDSRLALPEDSIYTEEYQKTGYIDNLDFIMIGTYYKTSKEINKYITLGNIITNGELPVYAGMALNDLPDPALQREIIQTGLMNASGIMLFDLCYTNWAIQKAAIKDRLYIKEFQLGISNPRDNSSFIEGTDKNINRNEDTIVIYDEEYGKSTTGTGVYGVEAAIDNQGKVIEVANQNTAKLWSWAVDAGIIKNDTKIPQGGYVISTQDKSGVRVLRQMLANNYNIGDEVRAAILRGYLDYEGLKITNDKLRINGVVEVIGFGKAEVKINNNQASVVENSRFTGEAILAEGENVIKIEVLVDGKKTNEKVIKVYKDPNGITLDYVPPVITVEGIEEGKIYNHPVTPVITLNESEASCTLSLNNNAYSNDEISQDGIYTLLVKAVDKAGNTSEKSISFTIDTTAPVIIISGNKDVYTIDELVDYKFKVTDALTGVISTTALDYSIEAYKLSIGFNRNVVEALDKAGNRAELAIEFEVKVTYDSLTALTASFTNKHNPSLLKKLEHAKAAEDNGNLKEKEAMLKTYISEIKAQTGEMFELHKADLLIKLAERL